MEKVVIRTETVRAISSAIIQESQGEESFEDLIKRLGKDQVLKRIYKEKELSYPNLVDEYNEFVKGKKSTVFVWMYVVDSKFGVTIDEHIYLHRYYYPVLENQKKIFPWIYTEKKMYIGDPWWSEDEEILADIRNLNICDFFEKYKGY